MKAAEFPSEEERAAGAATIYNHIAGVYYWTKRYDEMIVYENAAVALGDRMNADRICYGYYQLNDDDGAIRECSRTMAGDERNWSIRYWRGMAYYRSAQADAALADLTAVADSEHVLRGSAAIAMSMIYFNRGDNLGALNLLNRYTYLYDPSTTNRADVAVGYNNRCYAYMELGDLRKALDDCTASLKYGSLPDAYRKQAELIKRLGVHGTGL